MPSLKLLPGEREEARLRPHPLSWIPQYAMAGFPFLLGGFLLWLYHSDAWVNFDGGWFVGALWGNIAVAYIYPLIILAVAGAIVAVSAIRWKVFFGYMALGIIAVALGGALSAGVMETPAHYSWAIPTFLMALSLPVVATTELYRRTHRYILTNYRIIFRGGFFTSHERQLKYEAITDLDGQQGIFGRILNFGTLIPITQSGFGLGADNSMAMMGVGVGGGKGGMNAGVGVAAGGGKEVNVARARTYHQLTGIRPYRATKYKLEELIQSATSTPYLQQQVELQRQMLGAMQSMNQQQHHQYPPMPPAPQPAPVPHPYPQHQPSHEAHHHPHHYGNPHAGYQPPQHPPQERLPNLPDPYARMAHGTPPSPPQHQSSFGGGGGRPKPKKRGLFGRKEKQQEASGFEYEFRERDPVFEGRRVR